MRHREQIRARRPMVPINRVLEQEPDNVDALISMSVVCELLDRIYEALERLLHARELACS